MNAEQEIKELKEQVARLTELVNAVQIGSSTPSNRLASGFWRVRRAAWTARAKQRRKLRKASA